MLHILEALAAHAAHGGEGAKLVIGFAFAAMLAAPIGAGLLVRAAIVASVGEYRRRAMNWHRAPSRLEWQRCTERAARRAARAK